MTFSSESTFELPRSSAGRLLVRAAATARAIGEALIETNAGMRCFRKAERLQALSDADLVKLGISRDQIIQHAFRGLLIA
jgi:hypothetical protein